MQYVLRMRLAKRLTFSSFASTLFGRIKRSIIGTFDTGVFYPRQTQQIRATAHSINAIMQAIASDLSH